MTTLPDIPRLYTALAEVLAVLLYAHRLPPRMNQRVIWGVEAGWAVLLGAFLQATGKVPLAWWIPCMAMAILSMLLFLWVTRSITLLEAGYVCARAFILAELAASVEWQLHCVLWPQRGGAEPLSLLLLAAVYGGIFTATEAAAVSAVYGLFVGVVIYKTMKLRDIIEVFSSACETSGQTMFTIGTAALFSYVLTVSGISGSVTNLLTTYTNGNKVIFLIIVNIVLLIAGCFIDGNCCQYIFTPIFYPVCMSLGYSPIALGVVMAMNTAVGMVTPPVGCNLNVVSGVTGIPFKRVVSGVVPYIIAGAIALLLVTYIPEIATFLPDALNALKQ